MCCGCMTYTSAVSGNEGQRGARTGQGEEEGMGRCWLDEKEERREDASTGGAAGSTHGRARETPEILQTLWPLPWTKRLDLERSTKSMG
jgi:hypothetical protein